MPRRLHNLPLIEPVPIDDDLCSDVALIEPMWIGARLVFVAQQTVYESQSVVMVVKRKIVLPITALENIGTLALRHVGSLRRASA